MRARKPTARFVLVGDGPESDALAARHHDLIFAGLRVGEDLATHYASGDIFLFPSLTETYGNVTVEAMASGLAVVAYDYAAAAEHLRHGHDGMLADYDNLGEFTGLAVELVADPERMRTYGARARATALGLDWERVVQQLESVFMNVVEAGAAEHDPASSPNPV
jgi:glycosyltransferase involved in cell wall biosynthesis